MAAANVSVTITNSGVVQDWPEGFANALPSEPWLVVHCYPKQEKKLIGALRDKRIPGCIFFQRRVRHYPGKGKQTSLVPLLGGYVFVSTGIERKDDIYATRRVVRIIDVSQPKELARDLGNLCALMNRATTELVVRPEIVPGKRIAITEGVFAGCSGVVARRQNQLELVVNIELLGTSVSVTLPAEMAELATS